MKKGSLNYELYYNSLKNSNNFSRLSDDVLTNILSDFHVETWSKGDLAFEGNKTLRTFYFVVSGRVKMFEIDPNNGNEFILYLNTPGDIFDIICLLDGKRHDVQMEALDDVTLLAVPIETARNWILKYPDFNKFLLPYIGEKFREMEEKANDLALLDTWTRTLKLFVKHTQESIHGSELKLIDNLSHSEIAKIIGTSKNVISRHIQQLKSEHILAVSRKHIQIKDFKALLLKLKENKLGL